jgi:nucleoside-diphosphate-sugar epimerase
MQRFSTAPGSAKPFRIYNIGGGETVPLRTLVALLETTLGQKAKLMEQGRAEGDMEQTWADLRRSKAELGYGPTVTLQAGLGLSASYLRSLAAGA